MPKRIPIAAAQRVAEEQRCLQVILVAWDGERSHVVTYGVNRKECEQAANGGELVAAALGLRPVGKDVEHQLRNFRQAGRLVARVTAALSSLDPPLAEEELKAIRTGFRWEARNEPLERASKIADDAYAKWKEVADRPQREHSGPSYAAAVAGEAASREIALAIQALLENENGR